MATDSPINVGFGVEDYTPAEPANGSFKVYDPISYRVLILQQGEQNVTILTGDCFSIEQDMINRVKSRVSDIAWLNPDHIIASASHIGTAPVLYQSYVSCKCEDLKYFGKEDLLADHMAAAVRRAAQSMQPSRLGMGASSAPGILYNRRSYDQSGNLVMSNFKFPYPRPELTYAEADDNVYVVRVDDLDGNPKQCAFVFGCHALCNTDKYGNISADYPGVARRVLQAAGVDSLFIPGSIGNVVPVSRGGRTPERVGNSVAGAALYALEQTETGTTEALVVRQKTIQVPVYSSAAETAMAAETAITSDGYLRFQAYSREVSNRRQVMDYTITRISLSGGELIHLPGEFEFWRIGIYGKLDIAE